MNNEHDPYKLNRLMTELAYACEERAEKKVEFERADQRVSNAKNDLSNYIDQLIREAK